MVEKILGLPSNEMKQELLRMGQSCGWILMESGDDQLVYDTPSGPLLLSWASLPAETLGSFTFPRTLLVIRGNESAIAALNQALRCLRAGG